MTASPSGITEDVDIRCPESESLIDTVVSVLELSEVLGSAFGGDGVADLLKEVLVKCSGKPYGLREYCCDPGTGNSVKRFVPVVIRRDPESFDRGSSVTKLINFLFGCHLSDKLCSQLFTFLNAFLCDH